MPRTLEELATMISKRDGISYNEAMEAIHDCARLFGFVYLLRRVYGTIILSA